MMIVSEMDLSFTKRKKNKQRLQGLIKLIDGDALAEPWTLKMMTSL